MKRTDFAGSCVGWALRGMALASTVLLPGAGCDEDVGEGDHIDRLAVRVSVTSSGGEVRGGSLNCGLSADGRFVVFDSDAPDLVAGDGNGLRDIFVKDRSNGQVERVSAGLPRPFIASFVAFGHCFTPSISGSARYVAFEVEEIHQTGPTTQTTVRVPFVRDRILGTVARLFLTTMRPAMDILSPSVASRVSPGPWIAFKTRATNFTIAGGSLPATMATQIFVMRVDGLIPLTPILLSRRPDPSPPASVCNGECDAPRISDDGQVVAFSSVATDLVSPSPAAGVYVSTWGLTANNPELASRANGAMGAPLSVAIDPAISPNGRYVAFAAPIGPASLTIGVRDRLAVPPTLTAVSTDAAGNPVDFCRTPTLSADGVLVAFRFVDPGGGGEPQIRVRNRAVAGLFTASVNRAGTPADVACERPSISADGLWVGWHSAATNLVPGDTNGTSDIFVFGPLR